MKQIYIKDIVVEVEKKKIKNMYLRILPPDGRVHISAPLKTRDNTIEKFVLLKMDWIKSQQIRLKSRYSLEELEYVTGDNIIVWGKSYRLEVDFRNPRSKILIEDNRFILQIQDDSTKEQRAKVINMWYRNELRREIPILIARWENKIGVKVNDWIIRDMKTRWGTCNVRDKRITLNLQLATKHYQCLEYVVVHELVHLLEKSHNKVFKGYMDQFLPEWRMVRAKLNDF